MISCENCFKFEQSNFNLINQKISRFMKEKWMFDNGNRLNFGYSQVRGAVTPGYIQGTKKM